MDLLWTTLSEFPGEGPGGGGAGAGKSETGSCSSGGSTWCYLQANPISTGAGDYFFNAQLQVVQNREGADILLQANKLSCPVLGMWAEDMRLLGQKQKIITHGTVNSMLSVSVQWVCKTAVESQA